MFERHLMSVHVIAFAVVVGLLCHEDARATVVSSDRIHTLNSDGSIFSSSFARVSGTVNSVSEFHRAVVTFDVSSLAGSVVDTFALVLQMQVFSNSNVDVLVNGYDVAASGIAGAAAYADAGDGPVLATFDPPATGASPQSVADFSVLFGSGSTAVQQLNAAITNGSAFALGFSAAAASIGVVRLNSVNGAAVPVTLELTLLPEPATLALAGLGLLLCGRRSRHASRSQSAVTAPGQRQVVSAPLHSAPGDAGSFAGAPVAGVLMVISPTVSRPGRNPPTVRRRDTCSRPGHD